MVRQDLPIAAFRDEISGGVEDNSVVIVTAETGAGKSTQVPQYLLDEGYDIVVTQPRRLAARTVAARVAWERGERLGEVVGFRTAYERQDSPDTWCLFCTDGLALVRELMGVGRHQVLVLDEVHEWNINQEVLLAWAKAQIKAGVDFRVVVMSATMESDKLSDYFDGAPVITVPGRLFPVEEQPAGRKIEDDAAKLLGEGRNVLVFQPGKREIAETIADLKLREVNAELLPLHGQLTPEEQAKCFQHYGRPKCVVSTNVAQTSVTIDDIDAVVDSGTERRVELVDGVEGLYLKPISRADSEQRKGRAGRTKPGVYIDHNHCSAWDRLEFPKAEVLRTRLDQTVLRLAEAEIDAGKLEFFHQPDQNEIREAKRALKALGCMDQDGRVTRIGRLVAKLPVSVQFGRMVVEAERLGVVDDVIDIAALLEQGEITTRPRDQHEVPAWRQLVPDEHESDVMAQLAVYKAAQAMSKDEMRENGVFIKAYFQAKQRRRKLADALRGRVRRFQSSGKREHILRAVCAGMVDHLFQGSYGSYRNGEGQDRQLNRHSVVSAAKWLVGIPWGLEIKTRRGGKKTLHLIRMATKVDPQWLVEIAPQLAERKTGLNPRYDVQKDCVVSTTDTYFNGQKVRSEEVADGENPEAARIFAAWLAGRPALPGTCFDVVLSANAAKQAKARHLNVRAEKDLFKVYSQDEIIEERYVTALQGARRIAEVSEPKIMVLPALDQDQIASVLRDNPDTIEVLGSDLVVEYRAPSYGTLYAPRVKLSDELVAANKWFELPDEGVRLPGGRLVEVVVVSFGYHSMISDTDIPQLKAKVRDYLNQQQWDRWSDRPEIVIPDPTDEDSVVPFAIAVYGQCVVTGQELRAFGAVSWDSWHSRFKAVWYQDLFEAHNTADAAAKKLTELKVETKAVQEREQAKAEAETARRELKGLASHEDWSDLDYELRHEVEDRRYSYLSSLTKELNADKAKTEALKAKVEVAFVKLQCQREEEARRQAEAEARRAQAGTRLAKLLQDHLAVCPFCGQKLEWSEEDAGYIVERSALDLPCRCYPEDNLGEVLEAINAGVIGTSISFDGRCATVLYQLEVGNQPAIQFVMYYKYGQWNLVGVLDVDATIADGEVALVEVWQKPSETEVRLAELRRMAETYEDDLVRAKEDVAEGHSFKLRFRQGVNPRTGEEQWEAGSRKSGVKYVLDRRNLLRVKESQWYFCRDMRTLVETPRFTLILAEAYLPVNRDLTAEIAELEAELAGKKPAKSNGKAVKAEVKDEAEPEQPKSETVNLSKVDLSQLFGGRARAR